MQSWNIPTNDVEHLALRTEQEAGSRDSSSQKLDRCNAAVRLYVAHYNLCPVNETPRTMPAIAFGVADRVSAIDDLFGRSATRWLRLKGALQLQSSAGSTCTARARESVLSFDAR
ncbi:hypothetical protein IVB30_31290 [Bradyrhizobium sp. 200]|uniref:hypothetical protein n=1 Tax=Bradyrhizobium sp. 200 TaxID=2782665 RepID=UPI0020001A2D|nr:hypothetical protein [Bradyrhizobium sp. 200]UPJ47704.1 hypothetical protein IVB30_31290 [Bradyrhizobium sp. 200]